MRGFVFNFTQDSALLEFCSKVSPSVALMRTASDPFDGEGWNEAGGSLAFAVDFRVWAEDSVQECQDPWIATRRESTVMHNKATAMKKAKKQLEKERKANALKGMVAE